MTRSAQPRATPDGFEPGAQISRLATADASARLAPTSYDSAARTVSAVFSTGARVRRWGIVEELAMTPEAIDLQRVASNAVRLLDSHNAYSIDTVLGAVTSARIEGGQLVGNIRFADSEAGRRAEALVAAGDLTGLSVGYRVTSWTLTGMEDEVEIWRADRWELLEVSLVAVPADPAAMVRSGSAIPSQEEDAMRRNVQQATGAAPAETTHLPATPPAAPPASAVTETRAAPPAPAVDAEAIRRAERGRITEIRQIGATTRMEAAAIDQAVEGGTSVEEFRRIALDALAGRSDTTAVRSHVATVSMDETETRRLAMTEALTIRLSPPSAPGAQVPERARSYMEHSLVELAADAIGYRGRLSTPAQREDVLRRAFHTTSDFPIIFEGALNSALAARYVLAQPTYRRLARQRTYADFRDHNTVRPGDFPMLQPVTEAGEIKSGTFGEAKEKTSVKAYGIKVSITRQMLVNDTLGAISDVLATQATNVLTFEEKVFYAMMLSGTSSNGPTLLETSRQVYNTTDGTLAGTAAAISTDSIALGRAAMRKQKRSDGEFIDVAPAIILVGPDKETEAQKVLAPVQAVQASNVSLFSGALSQVTTARITGNAWYLFAEPSQAPVFEWGLLDGYTAPRMRMEEPFGTQGQSASLEHDFGCGAIDFRGSYRNAGA